MKFNDSFYITDLCGKLHMPQKSFLDLIESPVASFTPSPLLTHALWLHIKFELAKSAQNDAFTASIVYFLDVLKDFEIITVEDGFSADDLTQLEKEFYHSIQSNTSMPASFFIQLAQYEHYHLHLEDILNSVEWNVWPFPSENDIETLSADLNEILLKNQQAVKQLVDYFAKKEPFLPEFPYENQQHDECFRLFEFTYLSLSHSEKSISFHEIWFQARKQFVDSEDRLEKLIVFLPNQHQFVVLNEI